MLDVSNITPPRVPFLEAGTNWISREWYRWLLNMFSRVGSSDGDISGLMSAPLPGTVETAMDFGMQSMPFVGSDFGLEPSASAVLAAYTASCERIATVLGDGTKNQLTISGIPLGYQNLRLVISGRDTNTASEYLECSLLINNDTTAGNYNDVQWITVSGSTVTGGTTAATSNGVKVIQMPGAQNNSNATGSADILLPAYSGSYHKRIQSFSSSTYGTTPTTKLGHYTAVWKSTNPISRLDVIATGSVFVANTTVTLYGYR